VNGFLIDTNVVSEFRKERRSDKNVRGWANKHADSEMWMSVLVLGELRRGVELIRRRDPHSAEALSMWLEALTSDYRDRILPITAAIADRWARVTLPNPVPVVDGLLAATAIEHDLVLATRNVADIEPTGVAYENPFA